VEVRPGYKRTEAGVIPEGWEIKAIGEIADFANGKPYESKTTPDGAYNLITLDSIGIDGQLKDEHRKTECFDNSLQKDDIVIILSDLAHGNLLGLCDLIPCDGKYVLNQRVGRLRVAANTNAQYVRLQINFRQSHFKKRGQGTSQRHIYERDVAALRIPFPLLPEQRAIAEVLSDVDALIAALDRLIAKKRAIKQGAMQQLLTGQTRLPGFSEEWEVRKIGDIAPLQRGFDLPTSQLEKGVYPVVYSNGIQNYHSTPKAKSPGVVTGRSGTIGNVTYVEQDYWPHNTSLWVTDFKGNAPKFIYYLYTFIGLERFGTGSGVPTLNRNDVHANKVSIPLSNDEQQAIAAVLSDMDAEIAALEARREKTRALKQGMMQESLTGRMRLMP